MVPEPSDESVPDVPVTTVPDVGGFDAADACEMVRSAGLVPAGHGQAPVPTTGVIQAQHPPAGAVLTVGDRVFLQADPGNLAPG